jgi:hypothetical protein
MRQAALKCVCKATKLLNVRFLSMRLREMPMMDIDQGSTRIRVS